MNYEDLSHEEIMKIYELSGAAFFMTSLVFLAYLVYLVRIHTVFSLWSFIALSGLPSMVSAYVAGAVTFEVAYHQKVKKPLRFHIKRFVGRLLILLIGIAPFILLLALTDSFLSPYFGNRSFYVGIGVWVLVFTVVALKYKDFFGKLDSGRW